MYLKLISESDYQINLVVSCFSNKVIKLKKDKEITLNIPDNISKITIKPIKIQYSCTLVEKILKFVFGFIFILFYYILTPFIDEKIYPDFSDIIYIDEMEINTSLAKQHRFEVKYCYRNNSIFSSQKIQCKTTFKTNTFSDSLAVYNQIKKISRDYLLQHIFIFFPLIVFLIIVLIYSFIIQNANIIIISITMLVVNLVILAFVYNNTNNRLKRMCKTRNTGDGSLC